MKKIDIPFSTVVSIPAAVDEVANACFAELPASVVLDVDRVVVTGSTAATLVGHALARQLECHVSISGIDSGVLYIEPPLSSGSRILVLTDNLPPAADVEAVKEATKSVAQMLATCVIGGADDVVINTSVS